MSESKHTPGPWSVDIPYCEEGIYIQRNENTELIAQMIGENQQANAHLIAAAPKLLEAAKLFLRSKDCARTVIGKGSADYDIYYNGFDLAQAEIFAKQAIAEAEGEL